MKASFFDSLTSTSVPVGVPVGATATATKRKLRLCINWKNGYCSYGSACTYAHGSYDYDCSIPLCIEADKCEFGEKCFNRHLICWNHTTDMYEPKIINPKRKFVLCDMWKDNGSCKFSDESCNFAHGSVDLSFYVSECDKKENCSFGLKCKYRHNPEWKCNDRLKTKMCNGYFSGECKNKNCWYAHGSTDYNSSVKTCSFFLQNKCKKNDTCEFSHKIPSKDWSCEKVIIETLNVEDMKSLMFYLQKKIEQEEAEEVEVIIE